MHHKVRMGKKERKKDELAVEQQTSRIPRSQVYVTHVVSCPTLTPPTVPLCMYSASKERQRSFFVLVKSTLEMFTIGSASRVRTSRMVPW